MIFRRIHNGKTFPIQSITLGSHLFIFLLVVGIPSIISLVVVYFGKASGLNVFIITILACMPLYLVILYSIHSMRIKVSENEVSVSAGFYQVSLKRGDIDLLRMKIINDFSDTATQPKRRTNGIGLIFANIGWFESGTKKKLFLAQTRKVEMVYIPSLTGIDLLVTPKSPKALLDALSEP